MKSSPYTSFIWIPRILIIVLTLFLFVVASVNISGEDKWWQNLLMMVPGVLLLIILLLLWKRPLWTGILVLILGLSASLYFVLNSMWVSFLHTGFTLLLVGVLFIIAWFKKKKPDPVPMEY